MSSSNVTQLEKPNHSPRQRPTVVSVPHLDAIRPQLERALPVLRRSCCPEFEDG
eukprot:CAMPEP_0179973576 /NCGR_PEP_ID=MMETSP0983-20121128/37444_1 /TAXON_ID=483367 /ORGANISM="non described non described, Strain CCMP 2436" /LENGTH=53 /DNA_ID=CAMNT_0021889395 /DNA_START=434 /DNA_END=591 /DNA_ORIENTATION=+